MDKSVRIHLLLVAALVIGAGCDHQPSSKYPGELGAPCSADADCKNGMLCAATHLRGIPDSFCYTPCASADSECPVGSLCGSHSQLKASGTPETLRICYPACDTADFCRDLNPAFNACQTFDTTAEPICGTRG